MKTIIKAKITEKINNKYVAVLAESKKQKKNSSTTSLGEVKKNYIFKSKQKNLKVGDFVRLELSKRKYFPFLLFAICVLTLIGGSLSNRYLSSFWTSMIALLGCVIIISLSLLSKFKLNYIKVKCIKK